MTLSTVKQDGIRPESSLHMVPSRVLPHAVQLTWKHTSLALQVGTAKAVKGTRHKLLYLVALESEDGYSPHASEKKRKERSCGCVVESGENEAGAGRLEPPIPRHWAMPMWIPPAVPTAVLITTGLRRWPMVSSASTEAKDFGEMAIRAPEGLGCCKLSFMQALFASLD